MVVIIAFANKRLFCGNSNAYETKVNTLTLVIMRRLNTDNLLGSFDSIQDQYEVSVGSSLVLVY